jgi:hypothetical protein
MVINHSHHLSYGARGGVVVNALRYKRACHGFDSRWCHWNFSVTYLLLVALWPWGRLNLKQKWVPDVFPGGKGGRCVRLSTSPPSCAVLMQSGNLNFLEPSGLLQACNGTALPLPLPPLLTFKTQSFFEHQFLMNLRTNPNVFPYASLAGCNEDLVLFVT